MASQVLLVAILVLMCCSIHVTSLVNADDHLLTPAAVSLTPATTASLTPVATASLTPSAAASLTPVATASLTPATAASLSPVATASLSPAAAVSLTPATTASLTPATAASLTPAASALLTPAAAVSLTPAAASFTSIGEDNMRRTAEEKHLHTEGHIGRKFMGRQEGEGSKQETEHSKQETEHSKQEVINIKKQKIKNKAVSGKKWQEDNGVKKVVENHVKEDTSSASGGEDVPLMDAQTSGWFFEAGSINVTSVPIQTVPRSLPQPTTPEEATLKLEFRTEGHRLVLDLRPNRELLAASYRDPVVGTARDSGPPSVCEFQGSVRGVPGSWVALSLCQGIRGVIVGRGKELTVEPALDASTLEDPHHIFSASSHVPGACGVRSVVKKNKSKNNNSSSNSDQGDAVLQRERREALHGDPMWTSKTTRFVELVLVVDNSFYKNFLDKSVQRCRGIVNIVNAIFRPLNIVVVLTHLEIWDTKDQIDVVKDSNKTIDNFKPYRRKLLQTLPNVNNDNTQLLTVVDFDGVVGKGTLDRMCSYNYSVGIVQDEKRTWTSVARTMAHEMGHNLGLNHVEEKSCQCYNDACIMSPGGNVRDGAGSSLMTEMSWSLCSKENITKSINKYSFDCLKNIPTQLYSGSSCGNGVTEEGEECDCGPSEYCNNPCCNALSCKLVTNATCATGSCCDTDTCKPKTAWTVCRPAKGECDVPDYCSGNSEFCPLDVFEDDGAYCNGGKGYCYKGECGSHEGRCQHVLGSSASAGSPQCYTQSNTQGNYAGNCGILNEDSNTPLPCSPEDSLCGTLHCYIDSDDVKLPHGIVSFGECKTILSSNNYPPSYWLSPNGASCGPGKMCVNQRCISIPSSVPGMIFAMVVFLLLILFCCLWEHMQQWWNKRGREWIGPTFPCCARCLDSCCCPLVSKICQWLMSIGTSRRQKKPSQKGSALENGVANENLVSEVNQNTTESWEINPWGDEDEQQLAVRTVTYTPKNIKVPSNSNILYHNTIDLNHSAHHNSFTVAPESASVEVPMLNHLNSANYWPSVSLTRGQLPESAPTSPHTLGDEDVIDKLSKLTQNLTILAGKEDEPSGHDSNCTDGGYESSNKIHPQGSCDSPVKLVPVRKAPLPPVQKPTQDGGGTDSIISSVPVMPSGAHPTMSQSPQPSITHKKETATTQKSNPDSPPRPEPEVPPRPELTIPPRPEPSIPPRPEPTIPPRPEPTVSQRTEFAVLPRQKPVVPPRP